VLNKHRLAEERRCLATQAAVSVAALGWEGLLRSCFVRNMWLWFAFGNFAKVRRISVQHCAHDFCVLLRPSFAGPEDMVCTLWALQYIEGRAIILCEVIAHLPLEVYNLRRQFTYLAMILTLGLVFPPLAATLAVCMVATSV
jgi:hypothetical protein